MGACCSTARPSAGHTPDETDPLLGKVPQPVIAAVPPEVFEAAAPLEKARAAESDQAGVLAAGKLTGQALLQVAQQVPILAPVAFLVGAVASSASEAVVLKAGKTHILALPLPSPFLSRTHTHAQKTARSFKS